MSQPQPYVTLDKAASANGLANNLIKICYHCTFHVEVFPVMRVCKNFATLRKKDLPVHFPGEETVILLTPLDLGLLKISHGSGTLQNRSVHFHFQVTSTGVCEIKLKPPALVIYDSG